MAIDPYSSFPPEFLYLRQIPPLVWGWRGGKLLLLAGWGAGSVAGPLLCGEVCSGVLLVGFIGVFWWSLRVSLVGLQVGGKWCSDSLWEGRVNTPILGSLYFNTLKTKKPQH